MKRQKLTLIVPAYNEEAALRPFYEEASRIEKEMEEEVEFEYLFVDDGSSDRTYELLQELAEEHENIYYVSFSRNFGKEAAIYAGLQHARGDYAVILDADLQDPPALLPKMWKIIQEEGYDSVGSRRVSRTGEPPIRSFFARMFYKLINKMTQGMEIVDGARDFQMMNRKVIDAILSMKEYNRFSKGIFSWVGYKKKWLEYKNIERVAGETKWSFWKLMLYAFDGIIAFTTAPLVLSSVIGMVFCLIAFIMILVIIGRTLIIGDPTDGWPSMACIIIFVSGIQLFCMGILGQYISKTYLETKDRPIYLVGDTNIDKDK